MNINKNFADSANTNNRSLASVLHVRDAALAGFLIKEMRDNGILLLGNSESEIYNVVERFQGTDAGTQIVNGAVRNTALVGYLIKSLQESGTEISENIENTLFEAENKFHKTAAGNHFSREAHKVSQPI